MNHHLEKAVERLEAAVAALEKGGAGPGAGGDAARRDEIAAIQSTIAEAIQLLDTSSEGGGA